MKEQGIIQQMLADKEGTPCQTLKIKELIAACETIRECENLLSQLKAETPLGMNYHYKRKEGYIDNALSRSLQSYTMVNTFDYYHFESCFFWCTGNRKTKFFASSLSIQEQINVQALELGCKLLLSETQLSIIFKLNELKKEYENRSPDTCMELKLNCNSPIECTNIKSPQTPY